MDPNIFTDDSFGKCLKGIRHKKNKKISLENIFAKDKIIEEIEYYYFLPKTLPPAITISEEIKKLINTAEMLLKKINDLSLSCEQIKLLTTLEFDEKKYPMEYIENYLNAFQYSSDELNKCEKISVDLLVEIFYLLFPDTKGKVNSPFAPEVNFQKNEPFNEPEHSRFVYPPPDKKGELLNNWINYFNLSTQEPLLIKCAILHYQFEVIHPFINGNGKFGRFLIALYFSFSNIFNIPIINLTNYVTINSDEYFNKLFRVSTNGEWKEWIIFFLKGIIFQSETIFAENNMA